MAGFLDTQSDANQVEAIYIAYFGRAGDGPGYLFWTQQFSAALGAGQSVDTAANNIANSFAVQPEAKALYGFLASPPSQINANDPVQIAGVTSMVQSVYQNLFGRTPPSTDSGVQYWVNQILTQQVAVGTAIYAIANGALGVDQTVLADKITAAGTFTADSYQANLGTTSPLPSSFLAAARDSVAPVVDSASLTASQAASAAYAAGTTTSQNVQLTTVADNVTGTSIFGSLTPFNVNGIGPTLNSTDIITGTTPPVGQTPNNTLTVSDDYGVANDAIPVGTTINNIQNVILNTQGNAGGNAVFDTTPYASVNNVQINTSGIFLDNVKVSPTTTLTVTHQNVNSGAGQGVQTFGGSTVTVTNNGNVGSVTTIGSTTVANANPTGAITVNAVSSTTTVFGGTTVSVTQTGIGGGITIGTAGFSVSPAEPTGAVTINAPATSTVIPGNAVTILGGASDTVTTGGGLVTIGALVGQTVFSVSGNSTITDNAALTFGSNYVTGAISGVPVVAPATLVGNTVVNPFVENAVTVLGGQAVTITTNAGGVTVGANAATAYNGTVLIAGLEPTGNITVTDSSDASPHIGVLTASDGTVGPASTPVFVFGGATVAVTDSGSAVTVGSVAGTNVVAPTGSVTVTDTAQVPHDGIVNLDNNVTTIIGGTSSTVTTNAGDVLIGTAAGTAGTEPSGNITVTDTGTDAVTAFGGVADTISATNGAITVGNATAATNPSGAVAVTESGLFTGDTGLVNSSITVNGGAGVTASTTGGNVSIGSKATPVTGAVVVTDTQVGPSSDAISVIGGSATTGASVTITTNATSGAITVGLPGAPALNSAGTALAKPAAYPNGTISISDVSPSGSSAAGTSNVYGTGAISVNTNGATAVTIVGGNAATVVDEQTTPATGGASAGSPIGTSTLTTVSLDGVGNGVSTLTSGVLANLSVLDSAKNNATNVTVVSPAALALTLGNDAASTAPNPVATITDAKAPSITITTTGTASDWFSLSAAAATALTFNNAAPVILQASAASNDAAVKTITLTGAGAVTLPDFSAAATTADGALTSITASGSSGAVVVGGLNVFQTAFTGGSGNDTVTIVNNPNPGAGQTVQKIAGGTGSNTIIANYVAANTDVALHSANQISGFTTFGLGTLANSGVGPFTAPYTINPYDAGGFGSLTVGQTAGTVAFSDIGGGTTNLAITASQGPGNTPGGAIDYLLNDPAANADGLAITLGSDTSTLTTSITSTVNLIPDTITGGKGNKAAVNSISVASLGPATETGTHTITINDSIPNQSGGTGAGLNSIIVSGDHAATVLYNVAAAPAGTTTAATPTTSSVTTITVTDTAKVDVTGVHESASGVAITGGAGQLTAEGSGILAGSPLSTVAVDTFTTGSGGGIYTIGVGGAWNTTLNKGAGGNDSGSETINLSASTAVSDTLKAGPSISSINNGAGVGGVTGFQAVASAKAADVLALTGATGYSVLTNSAANASSPAGQQNVLAFVTSVSAALGTELTTYGNNTGSGAASFSNLTYSSSNGVITFGAVSGHNVNEFNPTLLLGAAEAITSAEALLTGQDQVAVFSAAFAGLSANTYIVASDMHNVGVFPAFEGHIYGASAVELNGVTGVSGFGATAALNSVETTGVAQPLPAAAGPFLTLGNGGVGDLGTVAGKTFTDTGFSEDTLGLVGGTTSSTNTYNGLGAYAQIDITAAGQQGNLVVGAQAGTAGSDSFELNFAPTAAAVTLNGLTVNSDDLVTIATAAGQTDTITTFTDAGGTVASLVVSGAGNLVITNAISDASLTSIDAHTDTGALTLTVTETVTINGALGGDTLNASGAGDTVTVGSTANAITGFISITANAAGDTITLTHEAAAGSFISAASGGDTITVDSGANNIGGTFSVSPPVAGASFVTALGAGDTLNLHSGAIFGINATDFAWVGGGSTVNLGTSTNAWGAGAQADAATIGVMGDTTGATSGNSPAMTVITGFNATAANSSLTLQFDGAGTIPLTAAVVTALGTSSPTFNWADNSAIKAQVNEASATSLANALDIAASQTVQIDALGGGGHTSVANGAAQLNAHTALADWFQYGGNTYVVEALNTTGAAAAHSALATTDVVVELTGLVNVATAGGHLHFV